MTLKEANLKITDRYNVVRNGEISSGPWFVESIEARGVVARHVGCKGFNSKTNEPYWIVVPGSHKHLAEWFLEIEKI